MNKKFRFTINYVIVNEDASSRSTIKENITPNIDLTESIFENFEYILENDFDLIDIYITDRLLREDYICQWYDNVSNTLMRNNSDIGNFIGERELLIEYTDIVYNELSKRITSEEDYYYV